MPRVTQRRHLEFGVGFRVKVSSAEVGAREREPGGGVQLGQKGGGTSSSVAILAPAPSAAASLSITSPPGMGKGALLGAALRPLA